jgi:hypothetical protein
MQLKKPFLSQGMQGAQIQHVDSHIPQADQLNTPETRGGICDKTNTEEQLTTHKNEGLTLQQSDLTMGMAGGGGQL